MGNGNEPTLLISGGGPVGLTLAALLAASPSASACRVRIVESGAPPRWDPARTDLRVYALSRASQRIFEDLGVWPAIVGARACPYERMRVWEGAEPAGSAAVAFDSADVGEPDLGHIVEDALIKDVLTKHLAAAAGVGVATRNVVESIEPGAGGMHVVLRDGERVCASLVVAADGGASKVREMLGLASIGRRYAQQAIVAHVVTERPHERTAWQRFLPGGPVALLPLADGRSSVVWSLPDGRAGELMRASDDVFLEALGDATAGALGRLGPVSERARFPLQMLHALRYCCSRGVLAGDAAHVVHPLAGQGMNLGLADALCLACEIDEAMRSGRDPGDMRVLRRYERRRKKENVQMLLALDALHHLFRLPEAAAPLRAAGLAAVDRAVPVKRFLMRQALGLGGRCERARGAGGHAAA